MQLLPDTVCVVGSRHGVMIDPGRRQCRLVRMERHGEMQVLHLRAGLRAGGRELVLPLAPEGETFFFHDQRTSPCTVSLRGLDPESGLKLKLEIIAPFRPRDAEFSTTPVIHLRLSVSKIAGTFRWSPATQKVDGVELFLEVGGPTVEVVGAGDDVLEARWVSRHQLTGRWVDGRQQREDVDVPQTDRWIALNGRRDGNQLVRAVAGGDSGVLDVAWCTHNGPVMEVAGQARPFRYAEKFADLSAVEAWARANPAALVDNARCVDGIIAANDGSLSLNSLLAYTLHSWSMNTWWVREGEAERLLCWEGSCGAISTVDVEFTQSPFYLAVWPELLGLLLDMWPRMSRDGRDSLGEAGEGTLFLEHDVGSLGRASYECGYNHFMEVEETANYLILLFAHWRRTGEESLIRRHEEIVRKYLLYLRAADTTGNGVPDRGCANTIDDGTPAIQFGREQMYLAVKTLGALLAGEVMLRQLGDTDAVGPCAEQAERIRRTIDEKGWKDDHFVCLLDPEAENLRSAWNGRGVKPDADGKVPGWDAAHLFTANTLAILDMVGLEVGLDDERVRMDLRTATARCLTEYGCTHTDAGNVHAGSEVVEGWMGESYRPGWISMNMLRDMAALYRGVDLRSLADRYWAWQLTTNSQHPSMFFETFNGNNLCFYPRGIAVWGMFDAMAGLVVDSAAGTVSASHPLGPVRVPRLWDAAWSAGTFTTA